MTSRPHDALFKAAFEHPEHAGGLLRSILPASICAAIDWTTLTHEPGSFIDTQLDDRHSDLVFSAKLADTESLAYFYILLEHQSTLDGHMPLRMLGYPARAENSPSLLSCGSGSATAKNSRARCRSCCRS